MSAGDAQTNAQPIARRDRDAAETTAKANLRQSIWGVSQYMATGAIVEYFNAVLDEIEADLK